MMDCKKALEEAEGDEEKAAEILRKKGVLKAAKRADKIVAEGLTCVKTIGKDTIIAEINSETDFVAKNETFKKLSEEIMEFLLVKKPSSAEDALNAVMDSGSSLQDFINSAAATIGEKISLRRFVILEKGDNEALGSYVHMGGKITAIVLLSGTADDDLAKEIAMHAAAANPKYIERSDVSSEILDKEKEIYTEQLKQQGKPENIIENIIKGKMNKFYGEICLPEQPFIKDEEKTVQKFLSEKGADIKIKKFVRYELGEGIEKKKPDYAAEVAEQMK